MSLGCDAIQVRYSEIREVVMRVEVSSPGAVDFVGGFGG